MTKAQPINVITARDVRRFRENVGYMDSVDEHGNALDYYQSIAVKSAIYPGKDTPFGLMYVALGLAEAGEVQNKVKKAFRDDGILEIEMLEQDDRRANVTFNPVTPERKKMIEKELRGVFWYLAATASELGLLLSDIAIGNLDELQGRSERGTLQGDGDNR